MEILNDCLGAKAYPSVLVYEAFDMVEQDEAQITQAQVDQWLEQAEQQDKDLFAEEDIDEQIRLFKMHEQRLSQVWTGEEGAEDDTLGPHGYYKLFWLHGKQKEVQMKTFRSKDELTRAYGELTTSKVMTQGYEIVSIKAASKRSKQDMKKLRDFINSEKQKEQAKMKEFEASLIDSSAKSGTE